MIAFVHSALWLLVLVQGLIACVLVYQLADLRRLIESGSVVASTQLPIGSVAPSFRATELRSDCAVDSTSFRGRRSVFLFLSIECSQCRKLASQLSKVPSEVLNGLVLFCDGTERGCRNYMSAVAATVPILRNGEADDVITLFRVAGSPVAVIVDENWRIAGFRYPSSLEEVLDSLVDKPAESAGESALQALQ